MEKVVVKNKFWKEKKVLITGHSGFKGSWLTLFLNSLGAEVYGISLEPKEKNKNLFYLLKNRFSWMNNFINDEDNIIELGCGPAFVKEFIKFVLKIFIGR